MSTELILLKYCLDKTNYLKLATHITKFEVDDEIRLLLNLIGRYYEKYPDEESISLDSLTTFFQLNYPKLKNGELYEKLLSQLATVEAPDDLIRDVVRKFHEKMVATEVINRLSPVLYEKQFDILPQIQDDLDNYKKLAGLEFDEKKMFVTHDLQTLMERQVYGPGLNWRLDCLNHDLGPLRGKTLGHVFACVDVGKTSFLASEASWMAKQLKDDESIIWMNNEEDGQKVMLRLYCAVLGKSKEEIAGNEARAAEFFKARGGERIKLYDASLISVEQITAVLKQVNARLLIIDQGDKVVFRGSSIMSGVERLKALYGKFRELAKEFDVAILTAGQGSATAEGEKWLNRTHMDNSKVGKPGELDYAIGIGMSTDENESAFRYINVCKNKLHNGAHGKWTVRLDTARAIYQNL